MLARKREKQIEKGVRRPTVVVVAVQVGGGCGMLWVPIGPHRLLTDRVAVSELVSVNDHNVLKFSFSRSKRKSTRIVHIRALKNSLPKTRAGDANSALCTSGSW
ncbi:hypothetical protein SCHPADRAFT_162974 [Schizopora paradoxa]|uniref:Uncharacterized protein n=1 Tax=Schizopora paradoxa TaxID=27342 RepID=A0A0H2S772_9AGAM|nr:hypothetical protein SCHPADRAFT_162974 [Schizopora paradoxa]